MRTVLMVGLVLCAVGLTTGCLNLGGGRQMVTLPWSYPAVAMDSTGSQMKNGKAAGAQGLANQAGAFPTGDQVMTIGNDQRNQRSTDASLAGEGSQAAGQQSPGGGVLSGTQSVDRRVTPTVNVGPAGGAQLGTGTAGGATPAATTVDPAAMTDAQAAALLERLRKAQAAVDAAAATPAAK